MLVSVVALHSITYSYLKTEMNNLGIWNWSKIQNTCDLLNLVEHISHKTFL